MSIRTITTQAEMDQAVADGVHCIKIRSPHGVWITVGACGSSTVTARDSSTVRACDSSTVTAYDSSTVRACDSSKVTARDSSTVTAYGSSTVTAYDSSTVRACDSSTVTAYGSSTVTAYGSSTVTAYDSSTVTAKARVAVHLHSGHAHIDGGVLIDHTAEPGDAAMWCAYHAVRVTHGIATLYKAVDDAWTTSRGFDYSPGATPSAPDWSPAPACGGGLHFSPSPIEALAYKPDATRFVAVGVALDTLVPILGGTPKAKAPAVVVACREVDMDGRGVRSDD